jgi:hypothetical protein
VGVTFFEWQTCKAFTDTFVRFFLTRRCDLHTFALMPALACASLADLAHDPLSTIPVAEEDPPWTTCRPVSKPWNSRCTP